MPRAIRRLQKTGSWLGRLLGLLKTDPGNEAARLVLSNLAVATNDAAAHNGVAYLLAERSEDLSEALKYAQQGGEIAPDNASSVDALGWILHMKGVYAASVTCLARAVSKEPTARRKYHPALAYLQGRRSNSGASRA